MHPEITDNLTQNKKIRENNYDNYVVFWIQTEESQETEYIIIFVQNTVCKQFRNNRTDSYRSIIATSTCITKLVLNNRYNNTDTKIIRTFLHKKVFGWTETGKLYNFGHLESH